MSGGVVGKVWYRQRTFWSMLTAIVFAVLAYGRPDDFRLLTCAGVILSALAAYFARAGGVRAAQAVGNQLVVQRRRGQALELSELINDAPAAPGLRRRGAGGSHGGRHGPGGRPA